MDIWSTIMTLLVLAVLGVGLLWAAFADRRRGEEISEDLHEQRHDRR